jgi:UDP-3-O-[3-hydroxymyristoyl] glucosamine N-acyltransferase
VNATTFWNSQSVSLEATIGDGVIIGDNPGVNVHFDVTRDASVTRFTVDEKDPSGKHL